MVARLSDARTIPPSQRTPTVVVPLNTSAI
jgi:hypothetical protein